MRLHYLSLKQKSAFSVVFLVLGLVFVLASNHAVASNVKAIMMGLGCAIILLGILLNVKLVRCPHCGEWIGRYAGTPVCNYCRQPLDWN